MAQLTGEITINETVLAEIDGDPRLSGGLDLPVSTLAIDNVTGYIYFKKTISPTGWVDLNSYLDLPDRPNIVFVNSLSDLPDPVGGVITLAANKIYYITGAVDLSGNRLVASQNTTINGGSSEVSSLISTGLSSSTPLITSAWSLPMHGLTISHGTAVSLDATGNAGQVLDWDDVNFLNCNTIGTITNYQAAVWAHCDISNSAGLTFNGTMTTIAMEQSLFSGVAGSAILTFASTLVITGRIRIIYSSFVVPATGTGIDADSAATIPVESYILDRVNFSGAGTYLSGITHTDNKASFSDCKGITNSSEIGQYYYTNNATQNPITTQNVFEKILGTTTAAAINQKFTHTNNRLTYTGGINRSFRVTAFASINSVVTNSITIKTRIAKNNTTLAESESQATTSASARNETFASQTIVELTTNDFIEVFVANETNANNVLCTELNVIIEALN